MKKSKSHDRLRIIILGLSIIFFILGCYYLFNKDIEMIKGQKLTDIFGRSLWCFFIFMFLSSVSMIIKNKEKEEEKRSQIQKKSKAINIFWLEVFSYFQEKPRNQEYKEKLRAEMFKYREYEVREMLEFHLKKRQISNDEDLRRSILNIVQNLESCYDEYFEFRYKNKVN